MVGSKSEAKGASRQFGLTVEVVRWGAGVRARGWSSLAAVLLQCTMSEPIREVLIHMVLVEQVAAINPELSEADLVIGISYDEARDFVESINEACWTSIRWWLPWKGGEEGGWW